MKFRLWIALMLVLALVMTMTATMTLTLTATMTLTALAEDGLGIEDAPITEDVLIIEDAPSIEDGLGIEDGLIPGDALIDDEVDLTLDDTVGLLPDDFASDQETAANGVEANTEYDVAIWSQLLAALNSAKNGDTIIIVHSVMFDVNNYAKISGKTVTVDLGAYRIIGKKDEIPLFIIDDGGEMVLKAGFFDINIGIMYDDRAVWIDRNGRFTMESGMIRENTMGVHNEGIFSMKSGWITHNDTGVLNCGAFIADSTSGICIITGNKKGVVTYFSDTAVTVSGIVDITGNTECDVLLQKGQVVAVGGPLHKGSRIGITLSDTNLPGPGVSVVVTRGLKGNGTAENFFVWGDYETGINADGELEVSLKESPTSPVPDMTLLAKLTASGKKALHLTWTAVDGAQGYDVYFGKCGEKLIKVATVTDGRSCKLKNLKKGKTYRAYVKAWTRAGGSKEYIGESSPKVYAIAGGYNNSRCNPKAVRVEKSKLSLKVGRSAKIKARVSGIKSHRKLLQKVSLVRYYSTNRNVATVTSTGKVTGVGVGSCKVWVVANNGVRKGVEVVVGN